MPTKDNKAGCASQGISSLALAKDELGVSYQHGSHGHQTLVESRVCPSRDEERSTNEHGGSDTMLTV